MSQQKYDLHCHSTASDGALPPAAVVRRAGEQGVTVLALTDHDTTAGLAEARACAGELPLRLIDGIELSATHLGQCLHIIGLNIDPAHPGLIRGLERQQSLRGERALKIAERLAKKNITGAYAAVSAAAGDAEITRSHFADFLLRQGYVGSQQEAFDRYLGQGKPGYVPTVWAGMDEVVAWITAAGGIAVLAHPLRYKLSLKWLDRTLSLFTEQGGRGIEVVNARGGDEEIRLSGMLARKHGLHASVGSDFHSPDNEWLELGRMPPLPPDLPGVWELF